MKRTTIATLTLLAFSFAANAQQPAQPTQVVLTAFGGSFPCQAGLTMFCDGGQSPTYMLLVSGAVAGTYAITAVLEDGTVSTVSAKVIGVNMYGWAMLPGLSFGGVVVSYTVTV
jgi:hypothetical protein